MMIIETLGPVIEWLLGVFFEIFFPFCENRVAEEAYSSHVPKTIKEKKEWQY